MATDPIVVEVVVPTDATPAFVAFTAEMGQWWDPLLTPDPATFTGIDVDPDGDVRMVCGDDKIPFGAVTCWEPDREFAMDFWLAHPKPASTVRVTFTAEGDTSTRVRLEHSGLPVESAGKFRHWDDLMARYAAHVSR